MAAAPDPRIGYIGLGDIGAPMAGRIADAGFALTVWNRTPARMPALARRGAATATSAAEVAARSDIVFLCIDTAAGIDDVLFGPTGVVASDRPPRLVVDNSTVHPVRTRDFGDRLAAHGIAMIDAPVSGGPRGAEAGTLAVFVGGTSEDVELARPAVMSYAGRLTHLGPLGSGQVAKACNQIVNFATMAAIAEATALGAAFGLDEGALPAAFEGGLADSAMLREYSRASAAGDNSGITGIVNGLRGLCLGRPDTASGGRVDILLKDLSISLETARAYGSAAPVSGVLDGIYRMLLNQRALR